MCSPSSTLGPQICRQKRNTHRNPLLWTCRDNARSEGLGLIWQWKKIQMEWIPGLWLPRSIDFVFSAFTEGTAVEPWPGFHQNMEFLFHFQKTTIWVSTLWVRTGPVSLWELFSLFRKHPSILLSWMPRCYPTVLLVNYNEIQFIREKQNKTTTGHYNSF